MSRRQLYMASWQHTLVFASFASESTIEVIVYWWIFLSSLIFCSMMGLGRYKRVLVLSHSIFLIFASGPVKFHCVSLLFCSLYYQPRLSLLNRSPCRNLMVKLLLRMACGLGRLGWLRCQTERISASPSRMSLLLRRICRQEWGYSFVRATRRIVRFMFI